MIIKTAYHNYIYGMINRVLKLSFSLTRRLPNDLLRATQPYEQLSRITKRVEIEILVRHQIPELVKCIDEVPHIKDIMSYNPYLTNGGY